LLGLTPDLPESATISLRRIWVCSLALMVRGFFPKILELSQNKKRHRTPDSYTVITPTKEESAVL
jgi:hypothetical protein